jgi:hypothetical protein
MNLNGENSKEQPKGVDIILNNYLYFGIFEKSPGEHNNFDC